MSGYFSGFSFAIARKLHSSASVIDFFSGEDAALSEVFCMGSDDELGMDNEIESDGEPAFEPFDDDEGNIQ